MLFGKQNHQDGCARMACYEETMVLNKIVDFFLGLLSASYIPVTIQLAIEFYNHIRSAYHQHSSLVANDLDV